MAGGKGSYEKEDWFPSSHQGQGKHVGSGFMCCSRRHSSDTKDVYLRSFLEVVANVLKMRMVVQLAVRKGACPSPLSGGKHCPSPDSLGPEQGL